HRNAHLVRRALLFRAGGRARDRLLDHGLGLDAARPGGGPAQRPPPASARHSYRHRGDQQSPARRGPAHAPAGVALSVSGAKAFDAKPLPANLRARRKAASETTVTQPSRNTPQFYLTAPSPCPYLPGHEERKVFTHLVGERAAELNDLLTHGGFRRSQSIAYRPACEHCRACVSVRVIVDDFRPTRSMRRIMERNGDLVGDMRAAVPTSEQYSVFRSYLDSRHRDGGMADMTVLDYAMMVEDSHVETRMIEYRR